MAAEYEKWLDYDLDLEGGGGWGKAKERVWPLTRQETTAFCDTWTQRLFFFPFQFHRRNFFGNFSNLLSKQESDGELDWAPGPQGVARSGHGEERLTASAMGHQRGCLCLKPVTTDHSRCSLHTPSLPSALGMPEKSLQKTKAWRIEAFPPRLLRNESGSVFILGSVEPRSSFGRCCPSTSLVPLVSGH